MSKQTSVCSCTRGWDAARRRLQGKESSDVANPLYNSVSQNSSDQSGTFLVDWWKQLFSFVASEKLSPPDASRMYAYIGTTMYEAQVCGAPDYMSLEATAQ